MTINRVNPTLKATKMQVFSSEKFPLHRGQKIVENPGEFPETAPCLEP